jgi:uncharacterized protein (DUF362 family)
VTEHAKNDLAEMNRRHFMALVAATSLVAALPSRGMADDAPSPGLPGAGPETGVSLAGVKKGSTKEAFAEAVREAAESATDFSWLSKGDSVFIKPVLNSGNPYPATTNPAAIEAVTALLKEKGAGRVVVGEMSGIEHVKLTPDGLKGSSRELAQNCGMGQAALAAGAELYFPEEDGWDAFSEEEPAAGSNWKAGITMPNILKEMDHIVLMPRCGRHMLAGSTLGLKAAVGYWRIDTRLEYHRDAATFHEKTAESNTVPSLLEKQRLVLTSATRTLSTFGPDKGYVMEPETGLIIASESVVAHDMLSLAWLLENRRLLSESEKRASKDPNMSQAFVTIANKVAVTWLGSFKEMLAAEKLTRNDIDSIWDDRVLRRAYELFGGVPKINLLDANAAIPPDTMQKLAAAVSPPAQTA